MLCISLGPQEKPVRGLVGTGAAESQAAAAEATRPPPQDSLLEPSAPGPGQHPEVSTKASQGVSPPPKISKAPQPRAEV